MGKRIKYLKISYKIEMVFGIIAAGWMSFFLGVMATDAPTSTYLHFTLGALFGFSAVAIPTVLIPFLAIKELSNYEIKGKLLFSIINAIFILISIFIPLALWQLYMLYKIKKARHITNL